MLFKCQETFKEKFDMMKTGYDKRLEEKDETIQNMRSRLSDIEQEKQRLKQELHSSMEKDTVIKEKIISIFTK